VETWACGLDWFEGGEYLECDEKEPFGFLFPKRLEEEDLLEYIAKVFGEGGTE
jgi:hypothetical protein